MKKSFIDILKGGPGSGSWDGPANPRFSWSGKADKLQKKEERKLKTMGLSKKGIEKTFSFENCESRISYDLETGFEKNNKNEKRITVDCGIWDKDEKQYAYLSVTYKKDLLSGEKSIIYNSISCQKQDAGVMKKFMDRHETMAKESGFAKAELYADISVGKYAWAKMGFEMNNDQLTKQKEGLNEYVKSLSKKKAFQKQKNDLASLGKSVDKIKTTRQLADFGKNVVALGSTFGFPKTRNPLTGTNFETKKMHVGKAYLLSEASWGWDGEKKL